MRIVAGLTEKTSTMPVGKYGKFVVKEKMGILEASSQTEISRVSSENGVCETPNKLPNVQDFFNIAKN